MYNASFDWRPFYHASNMMKHPSTYVPRSVNMVVRSDDRRFHETRTFACLELVYVLDQTEILFVKWDRRRLIKFSKIELARPP